MPVAVFEKVPARHSLRTGRLLSLAMRAKVKATTSTFVALWLSIRCRIRMPTEVAVEWRSKIATAHCSFTAVITTRMIGTVNRLVIVTHVAHGRHWAIRPRQLDVCSRASKHATR